jgi:hypothetical protein
LTICPTDSVAEGANFFAVFDGLGCRDAADLHQLRPWPLRQPTAPGINTRYLFVFQSYTFGRDL